MKNVRELKRIFKMKNVRDIKVNMKNEECERY